MGCLPSRYVQHYSFSPCFTACNYMCTRVPLAPRGGDGLPCSPGSLAPACYLVTSTDSCQVHGGGNRAVTESALYWPLLSLLFCGCQALGVVFRPTESDPMLSSSRAAVAWRCTIPMGREISRQGHSKLWRHRVRDSCAGVMLKA